MDHTDRVDEPTMSRRPRRRTSGVLKRAGIGLAALVALGAMAAPAAADWSKSVAISPLAATFTFGFPPSVATEPDGSFVAAWSHSLPGPKSSSVIEARRIDADGKRGPLLSLTSDKGDVRGPQVVVSPDGSALVTWHRVVDPHNIRLEARRIRADGTLGQMLTLSEDGDRALRTGYAVDSAGNTTAAWVDQVNDSSVLKVRQVAANDDLGPVHTLTKTIDGRVLEAAPAVGPDGKPFVVYDQFGRIKMQQLSTGGDPLPGVTQLSDDDDTAASLSAQADAAGVVHVSWGLLDPVPQQIFARTVDPDGTLGATQTVAPQRSAGADLAVNSGGAASLAWQDTPLGQQDPQSVQASTILPGGQPSPPVRLSVLTEAAGLNPHVAIDAQGTAISVWQRDIGGTSVTEAARFSSDGLLGRVSTLSRPSDLIPSPNIAMNPDGRALAVWWQGTPKSDGVVARAALFVPPATNPPPSSAPTPRCHGKRADIVGTSRNDKIVGTAGKDVIVGKAGADRIHGRAGNDLICGNRGRDVLRGGRGHDRLFGGPGRDSKRP
jgi:hypothetical protein